MYLFTAKVNIDVHSSRFKKKPWGSSCKTVKSDPEQVTLYRILLASIKRLTSKGNFILAVMHLGQSACDRRKLLGNRILLVSSLRSSSDSYSSDHLWWAQLGPAVAVLQQPQLSTPLRGLLKRVFQICRKSEMWVQLQTRTQSAKLAHPFLVLLRHGCTVGAQALDFDSILEGILEDTLVCRSFLHIWLITLVDGASADLQVDGLCYHFTK